LEKILLLTPLQKGRITLAGTQFTFVEADVCNASALESIFNDHIIESFIYYAYLKAAGESVAQPLR
jgi:UDP-glucose 4-epimerase